MADGAQVVIPVTTHLRLLGTRNRAPEAMARGLARITLQSASEFASGALFMVQLQANSTRHKRILPENYEVNRKITNEFVIRPEGTAYDHHDT